MSKLWRPEWACAGGPPPLSLCVEWGLRTVWGHRDGLDPPEPGKDPRTRKVMGRGADPGSMAHAMLTPNAHHLKRGGQVCNHNLSLGIGRLTS